MNPTPKNLSSDELSEAIENATANLTKLEHNLNIGSRPWNEVRLLSRALLQLARERDELKAEVKHWKRIEQKTHDVIGVMHDRLTTAYDDYKKLNTRAVDLEGDALNFRTRISELEKERDSLKRTESGLCDQVDSAYTRISSLESKLKAAEVEGAEMREQITAFVANGCHTGDCPHTIQAECNSEYRTQIRHLNHMLANTSTGQSALAVVEAARAFYEAVDEPVWEGTHQKLGDALSKFDTETGRG